MGASFGPMHTGRAVSSCRSSDVASSAVRAVQSGSMPRRLCRSPRTLPSSRSELGRRICLGQARRVLRVGPPMYEPSMSDSWLLLPVPIRRPVSLTAPPKTPYPSLITGTLPCRSSQVPCRACRQLLLPPQLSLHSTKLVDAQTHSTHLVVLTTTAVTALTMPAHSTSTAVLRLYELPPPPSTDAKAPNDAAVLPVT